MPKVSKGIGRGGARPGAGRKPKVAKVPEAVEAAAPVVSQAQAFDLTAEAREGAKKAIERLNKIIEHGSAPDAMSALGYDSAMILADAMKRANSTEPAKVRDALAATKDFDAVTGKITIDANRDASKSAVILRIEGGKMKYLETIAP